ncbi:MAG: hypothetical protein L0Z62_24005 [Gemmataceae bacterium]|nr:hypothetical protein [Gemmataceae bacterium]
MRRIVTALGLLLSLALLAPAQAQPVPSALRSSVGAGESVWVLPPGSGLDVFGKTHVGAPVWADLTIVPSAGWWAPFPTYRHLWLHRLPGGKIVTAPAPQASGEAPDAKPPPSGLAQRPFPDPNKAEIEQALKRWETYPQWQTTPLRTPPTDSKGRIRINVEAGKLTRLVLPDVKEVVEWDVEDGLGEFHVDEAGNTLVLAPPKAGAYFVTALVQPHFLTLIHLQRPVAIVPSPPVAWVVPVPGAKPVLRKFVIVVKGGLPQEQQQDQSVPETTPAGLEAALKADLAKTATKEDVSKLLESFRAIKTETETNRNMSFREVRARLAAALNESKAKLPQTGRVIEEMVNKRLERFGDTFRLSDFQDKPPLPPLFEEIIDALAR